MVDSSFNNDYYEDEGDKKSTIENETFLFLLITL